MILSRVSRQAFLLACCLSLIVAVGCGGGGGRKVATGTVSGKVSLAGQPLGTGTIVFFAENNGETAIGPISSDGTYTLKYGTGFSIPVGDYRVAINEGPPPGAPIPKPEDIMKAPPAAPTTSKIPAKFRDAKTSGLIAVVKPGSNSGVDFDLK
jgi:hypothetical protein